MSYQMQTQAPPVSRQNSHANYSSPPVISLENPKEETLLWQQNSYMGDSAIHSESSTYTLPSMGGKEDHLDSNSVAFHWDKHRFGQSLYKEQLDGSHGNYSSPIDLPLANPKEQTLQWQQNSFMGDSAIHSGTSTHGPSSLCGREDHLDSTSVPSHLHQSGFEQGFTQEHMDGYHSNYKSLQDVPLGNPKEQTLQWQQNSYMGDSGIHSGSSTHGPPSLCGKEDHLDNNSVATDWHQPGFGQGFTQQKGNENNQHLNQTHPQRDQFVPVHPTAAEHQPKLSQILEHAVVNLICYQDAADLVKLLSGEDQAGVREAAMRVHQLSKKEASRHAVLNSQQIVATLVHVMTFSNDPKIIESAAGVLHNLSLDKQGLLAIFKSSAIPALVKLLSSQVERVLNYAITTLHNLLLDLEESTMAVCLAGGLQKMIILLQRDNAQFLAVVTDCLRILAYENREIKLIMLVSGGPAELVRIMQSYTYDLLLCNTSSLLRSLLKILPMCSTNKLEIVEAGGIQALAMHLGHQNRRLVLNCLWSLRFLSDVATKQDNIDGLLQGLVQLLKSSDTKVVMHAACILCNMTCNERNKVTICQVDGIEALVHAIIQAGDKEEITEPAVCALRHITVSHPEEKMAQNAVRLHYGLQVLVKLLHPPSRWPLIKAVMGLIRNLTLCTANHAPLREYGVIPRLSQLLIKAYRNTQKQQPDVASSNSQATYIDGVRMEEIIERTLEILNNLADEVHTRTVIRGLNVIPAFIQLLHSDIENIRRLAGDVLSKLTADNKSIKRNKAEYVMSKGNYRSLSSMSLTNPKEQNLYKGNSGIHSGSSTQISRRLCEKEDDLNSISVAFDWDQRRFGQVFPQQEVNAKQAIATQFQMSKDKTQDCQQKLSIEPTNSLFRDDARIWTEMPIDMDINILGPKETYEDQMCQGSQGSPIVHAGASTHNPCTPQGFDLQVPVDSMRYLDVGKQVGQDRFETLDSDMDLDNLLNIDFDTLEVPIEPILPPSPQNGDIRQMASWYDSDQMCPMLPLSPHDGDVAEMVAWNTTECHLLQKMVISHKQLPGTTETITDRSLFLYRKTINL